jgi:hypothetical protein
MGLGGDRAILGYPWLRVFNPGINWDEGRVLGPPVEIETALLKWVKERNAREIVAAATSHEEWEPGDEIIANITQIPSHAAQQWAIEANKNCYAQALGVVDIGSLSVELSGKVRVRSGCPSCRASQGQNHGVRRGYRDSGEVRQSA